LSLVATATFVGMKRESVWWLKLWFWCGIVMIIMQVLLGGITRLTGSGLSITEWKPILGALYPSSDGEWQLAFAEYKKIAQSQFLNNDYGLAQFKYIFFWEWLHRNWARAIGLVFFVPFAIFIWRGIVHKGNAAKYSLLFAVGALQGFVGWIMVASGINDTNLYVNHFKLAAHFITALLALVLVWWYLLDLSKRGSVAAAKPMRKISLALIGLLGVQLAYGAFMAGLKAAAAAPTWPSINGAYVPNGMASASWWSSPINVHFVHRNIAYVLTLCILWATRVLYKTGLRGWSLWVPSLCVVAQVCLGILSVLTSQRAVRNGMGTFEWNALAHQLVALFLLLSLVNWLHLSVQPAKLEK
jgi:heme a synthase